MEKIPRGRLGGRKPDCAADGPKKKINSAIPEHLYKKLKRLAKAKGKTLSWMTCEVLTLALQELPDPAALSEHLHLDPTSDPEDSHEF